MKKFFYFSGKTLQLLGLLAMPSAMWIAHFEHDEPKSIGIFVGSIVIFFLGFLLLKVEK